MKPLYTGPCRIYEKKAIVPFRGQKFRKIRDECLSRENLFEDAQFPASDESIGEFEFPKDVLGIVWKRPTEIPGVVPVLFNRSKLIIRQDEFIKNSGFAAALCGMVENQQMLELVYQDQSFKDKYCGIFRFQFYQQGQRVEVVVDDLLPYRDYGSEHLRFGMDNMRDENDFGPALLEKAYAKLYGCYANLDSDVILESFSDIADGCVETILLSKFRQSEEFLGLHLRKHDMQDGLFTCWTSNNSEFAPRLRPHNLLAENIAYSICGVEESPVEFKGKYIMLLQNTWAEMTWKGCWDWDDEFWQQMNPGISDDLGFSNLPGTGHFWINIEDFLKEFHGVDICHKLPVGNLQVKYKAIYKKIEWQVIRFIGVWIPGFNIPDPRTGKAEWENPKIFIYSRWTKAPIVYDLIGRMKRDAARMERREAEKVERLRTKSRLEKFAAKRPIKWLIEHTKACKAKISNLILKKLGKLPVEEKPKTETVKERPSPIWVDLAQIPSGKLNEVGYELSIKPIQLKIFKCVKKCTENFPFSFYDNPQNFREIKCSGDFASLPRISICAELRHGTYAIVCSTSSTDEENEFVCKIKCPENIEEIKVNSAPGIEYSYQDRFDCEDMSTRHQDELMNPKGYGVGKSVPIQNIWKAERKKEREVRALKKRIKTFFGSLKQKLVSSSKCIWKTIKRLNCFGPPEEIKSPESPEWVMCNESDDMSKRLRSDCLSICTQPHPYERKPPPKKIIKEKPIVLTWRQIRK